MLYAMGGRWRADEVRRPSAQRVKDGPWVIDLLAVDHDSELQGVLVAEHGDVQADPVEYSRDRELGTLAGSAEIQRPMAIRERSRSRR